MAVIQTLAPLSGRGLFQTCDAHAVKPRPKMPQKTANTLSSGKLVEKPKMKKADRADPKHDPKTTTLSGSYGGRLHQPCVSQVSSE